MKLSILTGMIGSRGGSKEAHHKVILDLQQLVEVNQDRSREYELALEDVKDAKLRTIFSYYRQQSMEYVRTISGWIKTYDGSDAYQNYFTRPVLKSLWTALRSIFPKPQTDEIISSCEYREAVAVSIYKKVLNLHRLPQEALLEIKKQKEQIEEAFNQMISLSGSEVLYL